MDPQAQIGLDIHAEHVRWGNYVLQQLAGCYDFVAPHHYCGANVHKLSFIVRGASGWQMLSRLGGQGFGILSQEAPDQRFLLYWLYYYFDRHIGQGRHDQQRQDGRETAAGEQG